MTISDKIFNLPIPRKSPPVNLIVRELTSATRYFNYVLPLDSLLNFHKKIFSSFLLLSFNINSSTIHVARVVIFSVFYIVRLHISAFRHPTHVIVQYVGQLLCTLTPGIGNCYCIIEYILKFNIRRLYYILANCCQRPLSAGRILSRVSANVIYT